MERLESDLLRTFLAIADAGSVTGGAAKIFRSQSAASVQIKHLEELLGEAVFKRHGRGVVLSPAGEALAPIARQVVHTLDSTLADFKGSGLVGSLRIGIPDDHGRDLLSSIIAAFAREHPRVELTVHRALSTGFPKALATGALDMAVHEVARVAANMAFLKEESLQWVASQEHDLLDRDPLPLALFDRACWWRDAALSALQTAGRRYRVIYSSESVTGVAAAIDAGIAIGIMGTSAMSDGMLVLPESEGFPSLPASKLVLESGRGSGDAAATAMATAIVRAFSDA